METKNWVTSIQYPIQKQHFRCVFMKRSSKNMQQIYRRTPMQKWKLICNFIEVSLWHGCSPVNWLHIFRTPFPKNTYGGLLVPIIELYSLNATRKESIRTNVIFRGYRKATPGCNGLIKTFLKAPYRFPELVHIVLI